MEKAASENSSYVTFKKLERRLKDQWLPVVGIRWGRQAEHNVMKPLYVIF